MDKWYETEFLLEMRSPKGKKFSRTLKIVHNLPAKGNVNSIEAAFDNWLARADEFTSESLVKYINDKSEKFGLEHKALTEQQYRAIIGFNEDLREANQLN